MSTWILGAILLRVCLIGTHPFYEPRDVTADDRICGTYAAEELDLIVTISPTRARGHYRAVVHESGSRALYAIVLFRAGKRTFADISSESVPVVRTPGDASAPAIELLEAITQSHRHTVVRVVPEKTGVVAAMPSAATIAALFAPGSNIRHVTGTNGLSVVTESSHGSHQILLEHGQDDSLFSDEYYLAKRP